MNAYISTDNPEMCRLIGNSTDFKAVELFKAERRYHKYTLEEIRNRLRRERLNQQ